MPIVVPVKPPAVAVDRYPASTFLHNTYHTPSWRAYPTSIVAPAILATTVSTLVAVIFCRIMYLSGRKLSGGKGDSV